MTLKTTELLKINDAAKALKQKDIMFYNNLVIGLDRPQSQLIYIDLREQQIFLEPENGIIFNSRDLSAFCKTITIEDKFELDIECGTLPKISYIATTVGILSYKIDRHLQFSILNSICRVSSLEFSNTDEITNDVIWLMDSRKTDGAFKYVYNLNGKDYMMYLSSDLIPVNKKAKVYISVRDYITTFMCRFILVKSKFNIYIFSSFLRI